MIQYPHLLLPDIFIATSFYITNPVLVVGTSRVLNQAVLVEVRRVEFLSFLFARSRALLICPNSDSLTEGHSFSGTFKLVVAEPRSTPPPPLSPSPYLSVSPLILSSAPSLSQAMNSLSQHLQKRTPHR